MGDWAALEMKCVSQYLDACADFQAELQGLGEALAEEHTRLRCRSAPRTEPQLMHHTRKPPHPLVSFVHSRPPQAL
jgi:hypothetical protein